jgi:hypothetical protein
MSHFSSKKRKAICGHLRAFAETIQKGDYQYVYESKSVISLLCVA